MKFKLIAALALVMALPVQPVFSQSDDGTASRASSDVWSTWRKGFENYEKAESAAKSKNYDLAISHYRESLSSFRAVRKSNPNWNRSVISYRIDLCLRKIRAVQELQSAAAKQAEQAKPKTAVNAVPKRPVSQREDFVTQSLKMRARLAEAEKEIVSLKRSIELNAKAAEQVKSLIKEKNELVEKNNMLTLLLDDSKEKLKRADRSRDRDRRIVEEKAKVTALSDKLRNLEVEIDTLKRQKAEAQSRRNEAELALRQNVQQISALTASVETAKLVQKENQILLAQVVEMKKDRTELQKKLDEATRKIADLNSQLAKIREGIDLPENIRKIQDNANVVMKDNEYLRTLNTKNIKELELLRKSNQASASELTKVTAQYKEAAAGYSLASQQALQARTQLSATEKLAESYKNSVELLQKERDGLKTELSAFAKRYESLLKNASRSDSLSAELLKKEKELQALAKKTTDLDLAFAKLRQEHAAALDSLKKAEQLNAASAKEKAENEQRLAALTASTAAFAKEKAENEQKLAALAASTASLKANTDRLSAENLKLKTDSENLRASLVKSQELGKKIQLLTTENETLKREAAELKSSLDKFGKETAAGQLLARENTAMKASLTQAASEKAALAADYAKLKQRADTLKQELDRASAERTKLLTEQKTAKNNAELLKKYNETVANNNRLSAEYTKLKQEFEQFKASAAKVNQAAFSAEKVSKENERLKQEAQELREKLAGYTKKAEDNAASVAALTEENNRLKQNVQGLQAKGTGQTDRLAAENAKLSKEFDALKVTIGVQAADNAALKKALAGHQALQERSNALIAENRKLREDFTALQQAASKSDLSARIKTLDSENKNLRTEVTTLKGSVARLMKLVENPHMAPGQIEQTVQENASLKTEMQKLKNHIDSLNDQLTKNEARRKENDARLVALLASARNSQEFIKQRDETIRGLNAQIEQLKRRDPTSASKEIAELSATVTELKEGKVQFETALASLNTARKKLEAENAGLKSRLELAGRETEALKKQLGQPKPQGELERRNIELLEAASKYEKLYSQTSKERNELSTRVKNLDREMADAKKRLTESGSTIEQMRKELKQWTDDPIAMNDQTVYKKNQALNTIVGENDSLRREVERLKAELAVSNDSLRKNKLSMVAMEKRFREVLLSLKEYKQENTGAVLLIDSKKQDEADKEEEEKLKKHQEIIAKARELQKKKAQSKENAAGEKAAPAPETVETAEQKAARPADEAKYKSAMSIAAKAEKENNMAVALMNYWRAVDAWPESVEAHSGLVRVYLARGDKASAQKAYETARKFGLAQSKELETKLYGE